MSSLSLSCVFILCYFDCAFWRLFCILVICFQLLIHQFFYSKLHVVYSVVWWCSVEMSPSWILLSWIRYKCCVSILVTVPLTIIFHPWFNFFLCLYSMSCPEYRRHDSTPLNTISLTSLFNLFLQIFGSSILDHHPHPNHGLLIVGHLDMHSRDHCHLYNHKCQLWSVGCRWIHPHFGSDSSSFLDVDFCQSWCSLLLTLLNF